MWLALPSVGHVDPLAMAVVAIVAVACSLALLRWPKRSRAAMPALLFGTATLALYTYFGGDTAAPFGLLYLTTAALVVWFAPRARAVLHIAAIALAYVAAVWLARSPGEPPWPQVSSVDVGTALIGGCALVSATLLVDLFKRRFVEQSQRLAAIVDSAQTAIFAHDAEGAITVWNPGAERLYCYPARQAIGRPVHMLAPPDRAEQDATILGRVLGGERLEDHRTVHSRLDGAPIDVSLSISPVYGASGEIVGASWIVRDLTPETRAREQVLLRTTLLDEVEAAVVLSDETDTIRYWSKGAERLLGFRAEEVVGQQLVGLLPVELQPRARAYREQALEGRPTEGEMEVLDRTGNVLPVFFRVHGIQRTPRSRTLDATVTVAVDVSARRRAEQALRRHATAQSGISDLGRRALADAPLGTLFAQAMGIVCDSLGAAGALLVQAERQRLVARAAGGISEEGADGPLAEADAALAAHALRRHRSIVVGDWRDEHRFPASQEVTRHAVRRSLAVLVGDREKPFGVLVAHDPQGATDDLPLLETLANVLAEAMRSHESMQTLRAQALHDALTGLPNRSLFLDRAAQAIERGRRHDRLLAVMLMDLDQFKLVNDGFGHAVGDELLRLIGARLAGAMRAGDTLARLDGDVFAVLCEGLSSELDAVRAASALAVALQDPFQMGETEHRIAASVGIAVSSAGSSAGDLLRDAAAAMHHVKANGRGRVELFDDQMRARVLGRVRTEAALRRAMADEGEIDVGYQPLVSLLSGRPQGAEVLARWRHPDWGPVQPSEFIPIAEESGLIHELGAKIMRLAVAQRTTWAPQRQSCELALNISTRQLIDAEEVPTLVRDLLDDSGIPARLLTIEITESVLIEQLDTARRALESLSEIGVRLSLDDFGTGYSSLSYLRELPFDSLKIDRSLIRGLVDDQRVEAFVGAIVKMGHALDLTVVAEGVETAGQALKLRALGCDVGQGYFFSRVLGAEELAGFLTHRHRWFASAAKGRRDATEVAL